MKALLYIDLPPPIFMDTQLSALLVTSHLLEQLHDLGIDISSGQLSNLLTEGLDEYHAEKADLLRVGLSVSSCIQTDDTGARHAGKGGYCTHIGNELFAWFESTACKSRINFLELLRNGNSITISS